MDRALEFWNGRYLQAIANNEDIPARQHLQMEQGLLLLWRHPAQAIHDLYRLFRDPLKTTIQQQLQQFAPLGKGSEQQIQLPWRWDNRSAMEKAMLQEMGFGGDMPTETLERPGRLWLGLGLCAGLLLGLAFKTVISDWLEPNEPPLIVHTPTKPQPLIEHLETDNEKDWRLTLATPHMHKHITATPGARIEVNWSPEDHSCVEKLDDDAELWRCGFSTPSVRLADTVKRSLMVLQAKPNQTLQELAAALIAGGSADMVLIDANWPRHWQDLLGEQKKLIGQQQFLLLDAGDLTPDEETIASMLPAGKRRAWLRTSDWTGLTEALRFNGEAQSLVNRWTSLHLVAGESPAQFLLGGIGGCQPVDELNEASGLTFVRICPGEFMMGSPGNEKDRDPDEEPQHRVTIDEFWISKYETTFEQYDRFAEETKREKPKDEGWGREKRPVIYVNWNDAKAFCEHYGYRLPSEAEWEYAARAGSQERWSFGDDENQLKDYAWYEANNQDKTQPVGTTPKANDWGIYDMHGNVYEWVQDCYNGNYRGAPADGSAREGGECRSRVLRGGAFGFTARLLRSAVRFRDLPGFVIWYVGFRCARGSRRQP